MIHLPFLLIGTFSAIMVIMATNPIYAIISLIIVFLSAAGTLILLGHSYVGLIIIIIYLGAVGILFMFTLMLLSQKKHAIQRPTTIGILTMTLLGIVANLSIGSIRKRLTFEAELNSNLLNQSEIKELLIELGIILFKKEETLIWIAGLILLVGMLAAIMFSLSHQRWILRQKLDHQTKIKQSTKWIN